MNSRLICRESFSQQMDSCQEQTMWKKLICSKSEIQLLFTLTGGQCFRWRKTGEEEWTGVFAHRVWTLSQNDEYILFKVVDGPGNETSPKNTARVVPNSLKAGSKRKSKPDLNSTENASDENETLLKRYLRLDVNLEGFYETWGKKDPHFKEAAMKFSGVRILDQDPTENLFSFICSSNNNISRISSMVEKLCTLYGSPIAEVDGITYHDFPSISSLTDSSVEQALRDAGFGYRAKFIHQSACKIEQEGGFDWLHSLKSLPYIEAKAQLMKLPGIGAKVADCICLMSLGHLDAIPVDTHIFQVAVTKYLPHLKCCKSVTDRVYNEIGDYFRQLYGPHAGWAHTIIFCADLKMFQTKPSNDKVAKQSSSRSRSKKKEVRMPGIKKKKLVK